MKRILGNYYLLLLLVLIAGFFSKAVLANEHPAPRLANYIGLPVVVPGMDRWLNVSKPGTQLTNQWQQLFAGKTKLQQIEEVNIWANSQLSYRKDGDDQWMSPAQSLARGRGDCEDYAILKYYILKSLGFSESQLFMIVANDLVVRTEHAVLLINVDGQEYVLDNFTDNVISPAAALSVLNPEFAYSGSRSWVFGKKKSN